jgi:hypothetical protein
MDEGLGIWFQSWSRWMDMVMSTGLANMSMKTKIWIHHWQLEADILGFKQPAELARELCDDEKELADKVIFFQKLVLQYDLLQSLYSADVIRQRYVIEDPM